MYGFKELFLFNNNHFFSWGRRPRGIISKVLDGGLTVNEFDLLFYVHFRTYILGKDTNPLILSAMY